MKYTVLKNRGRFVHVLMLPVVMVLYSTQLYSETLPTKLHFPADCSLGETCYIQNYVDVDPTMDYHDFTCGFLSYNDHKGTDIRIPDTETMIKGVQVLAAAPGHVRAVRDGMPDISVKKIDPALIKNREAGNSVAIMHGNEWETQYSHLQKGSVMVKAGDSVQTGQPLGLVGMSGNTEFPHLHFTVRFKGQVIDPFTGNEIGSGCGQPGKNSLWDASITDKFVYQPTGVLNAGFTDIFPQAKPYYEHLLKKMALAQNSPRIIFWVHVFGVQDNDKQQMVILSPDGKIFAKSENILEKNQAQWLAMLGKKQKDNSWPAGTYTGKYMLVRKNGETQETVIDRTFEIVVGDSSAN